MAKPSSSIKHFLELCSIFIPRVRWKPQLDICCRHYILPWYCSISLARGSRSYIALRDVFIIFIQGSWDCYVSTEASDTSQRYIWSSHYFNNTAPLVHKVLGDCLLRSEKELLNRGLIDRQGRRYTVLLEDMRSLLTSSPQTADMWFYGCLMLSTESNRVSKRCVHDYGTMNSR